MIRTVLGTFQDNQLTDCETGEIIPCLTYQSVREEIQGKQGFYNLKVNDWGDYVIFQYVLLDMHY